MEHPNVMIPSNIEQYISDKWYSHMDKKAAEHAMTPNDQEFLDQIEKLEEANIIVDDELRIPIRVERTVAGVECPGQKSFEVPVFQVYVPRCCQDAATYLNDRALLETQILSNLIPFAIIKNDLPAYYSKMVKHAKYLHNHRSITIKNISKSDYVLVNSTQYINPRMKNAPLKNALRANKHIQNLHENFENNVITLSVTATTVDEITGLLALHVSLQPQLHSA